MSTTATDQTVGTTATDQVTIWVKDVHALEGHLEEALDEQITLETISPEVGRALQEFHDTVRDSKARIERHLATLDEDGDASSIKETIGEALGSMAGWVNKLRADSVARAVRDDYVAFSGIHVSYAMLATSARALGHEATAVIADQALADYARLIQRVNEILPTTTVDDIKANDDVVLVNATAADEGRAAIDAAWSK